MVEDWQGGAGSTVPGDDPTAGPEASPPNVPQVPAPPQPNYAPQPVYPPQPGYPPVYYPPQPGYGQWLNPATGWPVAQPGPWGGPYPPPGWGFQPGFGPGSYAPPGPGPGVVWGGIGLRFGALALDAVMLVVTLFALSLVASALGGTGTSGRADSAAAAAGIVWWLLVMVYHPTCWYVFGASPGQKVLGLRVVRASTGQDLGIGEVLVRYIIFIFVTVAFPLGIVSAAMAANDPFKRAWHDDVARSVVVRRLWPEPRR
jgi:uncharacterized RDD family membrane protein YckC